MHPARRTAVETSHIRVWIRSGFWMHPARRTAVETCRVLLSLPLLLDASCAPYGGWNSGIIETPPIPLKWCILRAVRRLKLYRAGLCFSCMSRCILRAVRRLKLSINKSDSLFKFSRCILRAVRRLKQFHSLVYASVLHDTSRAPHGGWKEKASAFGQRFFFCAGFLKISISWKFQLLFSWQTVQFYIVSDFWKICEFFVNSIDFFWKYAILKLALE